MGINIKNIFKNGMKEFKRRSALKKEKKDLKTKEKLYSQQLTALGKKAWESHIDIAEYGGLEKVIASTQDRLSESKEQNRKLDDQKNELESKKAAENKSYDAQRQDVESDKKEVDARINEQKKILKEAEKESSAAKKRMDDIAKEKESLNKKIANTETPDQEKAEHRTRLQTLESETGPIEQQIREASEKIKQANQALVPIESESAKHQKEIDRIKAEQKAVIGELDKSLAENKSQIDALEKKQSELTNEQDSNFEQLGEQLAGAETPAAALGSEYTDVQDTEKAIAVIKREMEILDEQGTDQSKSAFKKMIGVCIAGVVLIVAIIWLLTSVFGSKNLTPQEQAVEQMKKMLPGPVGDMLGNLGKNQPGGSTPGSGTPPGSTTPPADIADALKKLNKGTGDLKDQADKVYGKKIVVADQTTLSSILPAINGWTMSTPAYRKQQLGQMEGSFLSVDYSGVNNRRVNVNVTDTGHATALLTPYMMLFNMNINQDDERKYERVSTHNNMKVIEKFYKQSKRGSLTFIVKNRYLIALKTVGEDSITFLKNFMTNFNLSKLQ